MSSTFIFGISDAVDSSYLMSTDEVFNRTGQNVGNLAFHYAMVKILGENQEDHPWHTDPIWLNKIGKIGVMPCANQLGAHADYGTLAGRFSSLTFPLLAVGLGAQGSSKYDEIPVVPRGTQEWVKQIVGRSANGKPNIGVRGPFTLKVLEQYGLAESAVVTGCPTLFLSSDPELGKTIRMRAERKFEHIAVAAGHPRWKHLSKIESSLIRMMEKTGGSYIVQSPIQMVQLARGEAYMMSEEDLAECRDYACPEFSLPEFRVWTRKYCRAFFNISEWLEYLRGYDFIVGTRIHGVVLGMQAGIPGLCIAHDSRTRELCEVMHVPFVMANEVSKGLTRDDLRARFEFDDTAFDKNRKMLAERLNGFLKGNNVQQSAWLNKICTPA